MKVSHALISRAEAAAQKELPRGKNVRRRK